MGGHFCFELKRERFDAAKYAKALRAIKALPPPSKDVYVSYGPEDMGVAVVIKVKTRAEWTLMLPVNPLEYEMEAGFTYGIVSRGATWAYVKSVLCLLCSMVPDAFEFSYEDGDVGEQGFYDHRRGEFVVAHGNLAAPMMAASVLPHGQRQSAARA